MEESSICTAPPWLVHETILYSISSVLHHKQNQQHNKWNILSPVTVWKRYIWYYCLYIGKTMQLIHICFVNITIHYTSNYWSYMFNHNISKPQLEVLFLSLRIDVMSLQRIHFRRLNSELLVSCKHDNYETLICHILSKLCMTIMYVARIQFIALPNKK